MDLREKSENTNRHPWELSRSQIVLNLLRQNNNNIIYADIGAGDAYFTDKVTDITNNTVFAIDNEYCNKKSDGKVVYLNEISLLKDNSVDYLIMMDILEHIENDDSFFKECLTKLRSNGKIIITVPALQFLFSKHDEFLKHFRRYNKKQLSILLKNNNINIIDIHYFYTILFILRLIITVKEKIFHINNNKIGIGTWYYNEQNVLTKFLKFLLNIDYRLNKLIDRLSLPTIGLSLIAVCQKK